MKLLILALLGIVVASYPVIESCEDARYSGAYTLKMGHFEVDLECDADTDGGGWFTILARRNNPQNFQQNWRTYADDGIGSPETEYFLPLNFLHYLTSHQKLQMLVEMKYQDSYKWDFYESFFIGSESENFKLSIGAFEPLSTAGNGFDYHNNMQFSTYDKDNDGNPDSNCASVHESAGWFKKCYRVNIFGQYGNREKWRGINYLPTFDDFTSMDFLNIKLRKSKCANGFGSTCTSCLLGYYLPVYPIYPRLTCLYQCDILNCIACTNSIYRYCKVCKSGYFTNELGECIPGLEGSDPEEPSGGDNPEEHPLCKIDIKCSKIESYNLHSKDQSLSIKLNP